MSSVSPAALPASDLTEYEIWENLKKENYQKKQNLIMENYEKKQKSMEGRYKINQPISVELWENHLNKQKSIETGHKIKEIAMIALAIFGGLALLAASAVFLSITFSVTLPLVGIIAASSLNLVVTGVIAAAGLVALGIGINGIKNNNARLVLPKPVSEEEMKLKNTRNEIPQELSPTELQPAAPAQALHPSLVRLALSGSNIHPLSSNIHPLIGGAIETAPFLLTRILPVALRDVVSNGIYNPASLKQVAAAQSEKQAKADQGENKAKAEEASNSGAPESMKTPRKVILKEKILELKSNAFFVLKQASQSPELEEFLKNPDGFSDEQVKKLEVRVSELTKSRFSTLTINEHHSAAIELALEKNDLTEEDLASLESLVKEQGQLLTLAQIKALEKIISKQELTDEDFRVLEALIEGY